MELVRALDAGEYLLVEQAGVEPANHLLHASRRFLGSRGFEKFFSGQGETEGSGNVLVRSFLPL